jgi:signal transduction histidine kinase
MSQAATERGMALSREEARSALDQMAALEAATRAIAGVLSLPEVLQLIVDRVRELAGARYAALGIADGFGGIDQFITSGISAGERARIGALPRGRGLLGLIIREGRPVRIDDIASDPNRAGFPPHHPPMHTFLGVPVTVKGRPIGNFYLTEKLGGQPFTEADERLVETFALHAGIAIENARLHEDVQRLAIVDERDRIGRDLHDSIIQSLYAIGLSLEDVADLMSEDPTEAKARVERAIDALNTAIGEVRNFIFGLRPELLDRAGLAAGLAALADEFRVNTSLDVRLDTDGIRGDELTPDRAVELLQIAREGLSNVARHARAREVSLTMRRQDRAVVLAVTDDGVGFRPDAPRPRAHRGLTNMRERAAGIGATLTIASTEGAGTAITVRVPLGRPIGV